MRDEETTDISGYFILMIPGFSIPGEGEGRGKEYSCVETLGCLINKRIVICGKSLQSVLAAHSSFSKPMNTASRNVVANCKKMSSPLANRNGDISY